MTAETKLYCDNCLRDLTTRGPMPGYSIRLTCRAIPNEGGAEFSTFVYPEFEGQKDFCGLGCLRSWLNKQEAKRDE